MYLLDTMILSEVRKRPAQRDRNLVAWIKTAPSEQLFVSVVTIGEIERGIERQRSVDPGFAERLANWLEVTLRLYEGRILPVGLDVARRWGRLSHQVGNKGMDLAIAATALQHGLAVVTRNVSDFTPTGVTVINPFDPQDRS
ncbi:PilT protein-like protein [alpha proteobacterium BAL199]|jgi:toxin FitB|nr:PilT protein-like protein [alpha proteobacterium BAL199]